MIESDLTVAVDGHLNAVTAPALQALEILWQTVRDLPIGEYQLGAMERLLGSGTTSDMERLLFGGGQVDFPLVLADGAGVIVRVWRGDGLTASQRIAARYVPEQVQAPGRGVPGLWAVRDTQSGEFVSEEGQVVHFAIEDSARGWIGRQVNLAGYRSTRHLAGTE
ncbi:hypothetical protein KV557_09810 [Kitasatospora aureofaciens]|uniref:hypothetical protein n=1 Tax=Kitasatospora aureofaciens TaxID=1894 RepID=UPI001C483390|nr:hypothetical protein [Kitasatospora aureofaciens]MBV6697418.1 hypothetical protein [Kitasatospora aureofaciens]